MTSSRVATTAAAATHLVVYAIAGSIVLAAIGMLAGFTIGFIPLFGVGLLLLPLFTWTILGVAKFENARVGGLFGYPTPHLAARTSDRTDGWRWLHTQWLRAIDGRAWLGVLHVVIMTAVGGAALWLVQHGVTTLVVGITALLHPMDASRIPFSTLEPVGWFAGIIDIALTAAAVVGLYFLGRAHAGFSRMLIPSRVDELEEVAAVATARRDDAVQAATVERTRIERDLHDGVQPRLVSIGMTLGLAKTKIDSDPTAAAALIDEAHLSTKEAITELRQLARGIRPAVLEDRGLDAALSALAARSPIPVTLDVRLDGRCGEATESAMYFAVAEALTNAAKHAAATSCRVTILSRPGGMIWARIEDDGIGGARAVPGGGIDGMIRRVQAAGGTLSLTSPESGPTTIEVSLPCAS